MKRFILLFIISVVSILPFKVSAVELEKSFDKNFDISLNNYFASIYSYDNDGDFNGYLLYENSYNDKGSVVMISPDNKIVWSKSNDVVTEFDVSTPYSGNSRNLVVKRINPDTKETIWESTIDDVSYSYKALNSYDDKENMDGLIVCFSIESSETYTPGTYIIKYDMNGNVLWNKSVGKSVLKSDNGETLRVFSRGPTYGMYEIVFLNVSTNTTLLPISLVVSGSPDCLFFNDSNEVIVVYNSRQKPYGTGLKEITKMNANQEILLTREFNSKAYSIVNNKNYDGVSDGSIIIASSDGVIKMDSDFNVISKFDVDYTVNKIIESRDSNGEFNGYLMIGSNNGKLYLTNFTYPKRVIESKNSDVEVISDAYPGKTITLKPKEKEGYYVKRIIVRDSSGKEIEVSSDNTFVMPDDDVSIEVVYEKRETIVNPDTASTISIVLVIVSVIIFGTVLIRVTVLDKSI